MRVGYKSCEEKYVAQLRSLVADERINCDMIRLSGLSGSSLVDALIALTENQLKLSPEDQIMVDGYVALQELHPSHFSSASNASYASGQCSRIKPDSYKSINGF